MLPYFSSLVVSSCFLLSSTLIALLFQNQSGDEGVNLNKEAEKAKQEVSSGIILLLKFVILSILRDSKLGKHSCPIFGHSFLCRLRKARRYFCVAQIP